METNTTKPTWVLDPTHSELTFKVRHMMIANVKGAFTDFSIQIEGEDLLQSNILVTVAADSIQTNQTDRDNHLKSADFFDTELFKTLSFKSTSLKHKEDNEYVLKGLLTIKDVEKEVALEVDFGGINKDPWGNEKAGFSVSGKINRKDWGLHWNAALETGGMLVSEEVKIFAELQFVKQA